MMKQPSTIQISRRNALKGAGAAAITTAALPGLAAAFAPTDGLVQTPIKTNAQAEIARIADKIDSLIRDRDALNAAASKLDTVLDLEKSGALTPVAERNSGWLISAQLADAVRHKHGYPDSVLSPPRSRATLGKFYAARHLVDVELSSYFYLMEVLEPKNGIEADLKRTALSHKHSVLGRLA